MIEVKGMHKGIEQEFLKCSKCGEEIMTEAQAEYFMKYAKKIR